MPVEFYDRDLCNGCGTCVITCPCDVFRMDKENKKTLIAYQSECQVCGMCTIYCPTGAIVVTPEKDIKAMTAYM